MPEAEPSPPNPLARTLKLVLLLVGLYLAIGVLQYPWWWYGVLSNGDFEKFLSEALGPYFEYNLALILALVAIGYFHFHGQRTGLPWAWWLNRALDSTLFPSLIWGLLLLGVSRAFFVGIDSSTELRKASAERADASPLRAVVSLPIEVVYVDRSRLSDIFGQIQGELKLTEQKVSQKDSVEAEAGGSMGPATLKAKNAKEAERSSTFTSVEPNDPVKIVRTLEYLASKDKLLSVRSIELQSIELKEFEAAVELLTTKHLLPLPKGPIEERRRALIEANLRQSAPKQFAVGSWVLIDGHVQATPAPGLRAAYLRFEYVPSLPSRVAFTCSVPASETKTSEVAQSKEPQKLKLRVFAKIASANTVGSQVLYTLSCYAAFR